MLVPVYCAKHVRTHLVMWGDYVEQNAFQVPFIGNKARFVTFYYILPNV